MLDSTQNSEKKSYFEEREKMFSVDTKKLRTVAAFPKNALIELNNSCNHACVFCKNPDQARGSTQLQKRIFEKFVSQAVQLGLEEIGLYATGEPFMTKDLESYIQVARQSKVRRIYVTTNGALATLEKVKLCYEAGLASIKFSINAGNQRDYFKIHGHDDFDKVLENVKDIYAWKKENNIELQMLGSCVSIPSLTGSVEQHREIFGKYFDDIQYVTAGSQGGQAFELPLSTEERSEIFGNLKEQTKSSKPCQLPWIRAHLTAEGYLTACCVDYNLDLVFGDLNIESLSEIWNNDTVRKLRAMHLKEDLNGLICDQCLNNRPAPYEPLTPVGKKLKSAKLFSQDRSKLIGRIIAIKSQI
jgi:MoaA/NifB/PqqE/SkfB family radical SAM enzyme